MDLTPLCHEVIRRLTAERDAPRYMIRFADGDAGRRFVSLLRERLSSGPDRHLADALELFDRPGLIRLRLKDGLPAGDDGLWLAEEDRKLDLATTKVVLPFTGGAALDFDPGKKIPWGVADIGAPKLWNKSRGRRVKIGVIDTGADFRHPDIRHALRKGINILDHRLPADDDNGHGTHIAGTIAAGAGTRRGIRGVAPGAEIHPVKAFDREGSAYVSDIVLAVEWCLENGMHIINMSFGMPDFSRILHEAVRKAWDRRVTVVASAGNGGKKAEVDFPARSSAVIAVGAINRRGRIASFSNRGREVDVYAPGEAIYSAWLKGRYNELNGTSMAAAHVSGTVALILARRRSMGPEEVRRVITESAAPLSGPDQAADRAGRLNAVRAFALAMKRAGAAARRTGSRHAAGGRAAASSGGAAWDRSAVRARKHLKTAASGRPGGNAPRRRKAAGAAMRARGKGRRAGRIVRRPARRPSRRSG